MVGRRGIPRLEPVLTQIATAQGPTEFFLLEEIQLTSMNLRRAHTNGRVGWVTQRAARSGAQVVADVEIGLAENEFESQVMLEAGQFLVLGHAGYDGNSPFPDARPEDLLTLYYVMAADLDP